MRNLVNIKVGLDEDGGVVDQIFIFKEIQAESYEHQKEAKVLFNLCGL